MQQIWRNFKFGDCSALAPATSSGSKVKHSLVTTYTHSDLTPSRINAGSTIVEISPGVPDQCS